jgi:hypothetical protein
MHEEIWEHALSYINVNAGIIMVNNNSAKHSSQCMTDPQYTFATGENGPVLPIKKKQNSK